MYAVRYMLTDKLGILRFKTNLFFRFVAQQRSPLPVSSVSKVTTATEVRKLEISFALRSQWI